MTLAFGVQVALTLFRKEKLPRVAKDYLAKLGGLPLKFGQLLAHRYDLLPHAYCAEFANLLDEVKPMPIEEVVNVIRRSRIGGIDSTFAEFSPVPIASASIAQVHEALLRECGSRVAVKVKRPDVEAKVRFDLTLCRRLAGVLTIFAPTLASQAKQTIEELSRFTLEEMDFRLEAVNCRDLHDAMEVDEIDHRGPNVFDKLSCRNVLVMEYIEGPTLNTYLRAKAAGDTEFLAMMAEQGWTERRIPRLIFHSIMTQCYRHRIFHADPHPANIVLMPSGTLGFVDFGIIGRLDERAWATQFKMRQYMAHNKLHAAYETFLDSIEPVPENLPPTLEFEIQHLMRLYMSSGHGGGGGDFASRSSLNMFYGIFRVMRKLNLCLPVNTFRLYRAMALSDTCMLTVNSEFDWRKELDAFVEREERVQMRTLFSLENLRACAQGWAMLAQQIPVVSGDIIDWSGTTLPALGRKYRKTLSLTERLVSYLIQLGGFAALFFGLILLFMPNLSWWNIRESQTSKLLAGVLLVVFGFKVKAAFKAVTLDK